MPPLCTGDSLVSVICQLSRAMRESELEVEEGEWEDIVCWGNEGRPFSLAAVTSASLGKFGSPDTFQFNVSSREKVQLLKTGPEVENG